MRVTCSLFLTSTGHRSGRSRNQNSGGVAQRRTPSGSSLASNSHIQIVAREPDSDVQGTNSDEDVPIFRSTSYQLLSQRSKQKTLPLSAHGQASFADMARSGIISDNAAYEQPNAFDGLFQTAAAQSGPGILRLRPSSRAKSSRVWRPLDLDCS
jgi:hypothetical protein